ncbi:MAG: transketolase [Sphingobacteriia bacterium]|nr:transketolase [Sphingobacteriia bacterium]
MANAIRFLSMDAVEKAKSGHPGMPMGMADIAIVLFSEFLNFNPQQPNWLNRDRFILSNGHGSMLQYALLHLFGYDLSIEDIKDFRQLGSKTPGHPEYGHTIGVETTTGPLGQGVANAVGMAIAAKKLQSEIGADLLNNKIYVFVGDGCLMEGITHEAISLAGHLNLNNLVVIFDDNSISIDGNTELSASENYIETFKACSFDTNSINGHDYDEIRAAIFRANKSEKPYFIAAKTIIGFGAPNKAGSEAAHGAPLGEDEITKTREKLGWPHNKFEVPKEVYSYFNDVVSKKVKIYDEWANKLNLSSNKIKDLIKNIENKYYLKNLDKALKEAKDFIQNNKKPEATRKSSGNILNILGKHLINLVGGSADLTISNETKPGYFKPITKNDFSGKYVYYGVREHAMGAIMNGMTLFGNIIPYAGTFLTFSDYMKPAIRLASLMKLKVIYVFTHDSIGLGEDGPTHQPVEHLASLRAIPNLQVLRPCDATETLEAWELALKYEGPTALILTRQNLEPLRDSSENNLSSNGGYIIRGNNEATKVTLFATGSEVEIAVKVHENLSKKGISSKVFSLPCIEKFVENSELYKQVLNEKNLKIGIEAAIKFGWERLIGTDGIFVGVESFGASGPYKELYEHYGIAPEKIIEKIERKLKEMDVG